MKKVKIVIDTNVLLSALKSRNGFSFKLLSMIDDQRFEIKISIPLVLEYEDVLKRDGKKLGLNYNDIEVIIDYLCSVGNKRKIFYLWRPFLKDPKDDMILELAVEAECEYIITFNKKDFKNIDQFNIKAITPKEFMEIIGELL
jgi:putative PIN family toxin of toxin-antitoxin system